MNYCSCIQCAFFLVLFLAFTIYTALDFLAATIGEPILVSIKFSSDEEATSADTIAPVVYKNESFNFSTSVNGIKNIDFSTSAVVKIRDDDPWWSCPEPGKGRKSIMISALIRGRLGNVVWSYLTIVVTAKMFGLRPVLHSWHIDFMAHRAFDREHLRVPTAEWLDKKCNMSGWLDKTLENANISKTLRNREDLYRFLEKPPESGLDLYRFTFYVTATELLVPHFYELKKELVLKKDVTILAEKHLKAVKSSFLNQLKNKGMHTANFEFVGVHVRRTDYLHHMGVVFPFGKVASPKFFHAAMDWLIKELNKPLVFVAVSDDRSWTQANIVAGRTDVYLKGTGRISNPGVDLAILAACNHTIFAYGTFGLSAAFLASQPGAHAIVFDPENGTVTKEMEFASNLPGWRIMTEDGKITYRKNKLDYAFHGHKRVNVKKNAK